MRPLALTVTLALGLFGGCRVHTLDDGDYDFTVDRVLRDECGLAGAPLLGTGTLVTAGHQVTLALDRPEAQLVGTYLYAQEQTVLDGTITNLATVLRGQQCLVDVVTLHMETVTIDPSRFRGTMSIAWDARQPDACVCQVWFDFTAARKP